MWFLASSNFLPTGEMHRMHNLMYFPSGAHPEVPRKPWRALLVGFLPAHRGRFVETGIRVCSEQTSLTGSGCCSENCHSALVSLRKYRKCTLVTITKVVSCFGCVVLTVYQFSSDLEPSHRRRTLLEGISSSPCTARMRLL